MDTNARRQFESQVDFSVFPPAMPGSPVWQEPNQVPPNSRGMIATDPHDCMTLACLCPFFGVTKLFVKIFVGKYPTRRDMFVAEWRPVGHGISEGV